MIKEKCLHYRNNYRKHAIIYIGIVLMKTWFIMSVFKVDTKGNKINEPKATR